MAAAIPSEVPACFTAGDTVSWKISISDYPAGEDWALSYVLIRRQGGLRIPIASAGSGDDHLVTITATESAAWLPGDYDWQAYVTNDDQSERYCVATGRLTILTNFQAVAEGGEDIRTMARKTLDALEAAILKVSLAQQAGTAGSILEWEAEGLKIKRSSPDSLLTALQTQRDRYAAIVSNEEVAARLAAGKRSGRRILTHFRSPA